MLYSMTGFSSKIIKIPVGSKKVLGVEVELKSLNSRFFELNTKLPFAMHSMETEILVLLKEILYRGKVSIVVHANELQEELESVIPAINTAQLYVNALRKIQKESKLSGSISVSDIVHLPGIFISSKNLLSSSIKKAIEKGFVELAHDLMKIRKTEGERLEKDIKKRFAICAKELSSIEKNFNSIIKEQKEVTSAKLSLAQAGDIAAKAELEIAYQALSKMDITEEITRFRTHLEAIDSLFVDKTIEKGKQLDFTLQELMREINTIAAKCASHKISSSSVNVKVELEKIREQVQNIL